MSNVFENPWNVSVIVGCVTIVTCIQNNLILSLFFCQLNFTGFSFFSSKMKISVIFYWSRIFANNFSSASKFLGNYKLFVSFLPIKTLWSRVRMIFIMAAMCHRRKGPAWVILTMTKSRYIHEKMSLAIFYCISCVREWSLAAMFLRLRIIRRSVAHWCVQTWKLR